MNYLTSDIHGCFQDFKKMLKYIHFGPEDHMYIIGDVVDRGPEPIPLLKYVMDQPNMELLMGNHEQGFVWNIDKNTSKMTDENVRRFWLEHGGWETWNQYQALPKEEQERIRLYVKNLPLYKIIGKNILVHAGVFTEGIEYDTLEELMEQQDPFRILWEQKGFYGRPLHLKDPEARVFFGHTFSLIIREDLGLPLDSSEIFKDGNKIGLDCGFAFGGRMVIYCLDDDMAYYLTSSGNFYKKNEKSQKTLDF